MQWNAQDYANHSTAQQVWARELLGRLLLRGDEWILDVGCGDGKVTIELASAVPRGGVTGIDASPEMIAFAHDRYPAQTYPNLEFRQMDARTIDLPRRYDVIFSNAALHWVSDHPAFLRGAARALKTGGRLIVSCGGHGNAQQVFAAVRAEMRLPAWRAYFRQLRKPYFFHRPEEYALWLPEAGFRTEVVQLVEKDMVHAGRAGLASWLRSTWIPYTQCVPEPQREEFITRVVERYVAKHPLDAADRVHVRMVRLEIQAVRL